MQPSPRANIRPVVWGLLGAVVGLVFFYTGGIRFNAFEELEAHGSWKNLFSLTGRELGFYLLGIVFLFPGACCLALGMARASNGELARSLEGFGRRVNSRVFVATVCIVFAALALGLRHGILHGALLTDDEEVYLFQARLLLHGKLSIVPPPDERFFRNGFLTYWNGRWFPVYPWAHPLFLALGLSIHFPSLIPVLLNIGTLILTYLIASRLATRGVALAAATLFALSPFAEFQAATYLSESTSGFFVALASWAFLELQASERGRWAALCGAALGVVVNCRPLTAVGAVLGIGIWCALVLVRTRGAFFKRLWPIVPTALAGVALYLLMNRLTQGDSFLPAPLLHANTGLIGFATIDPGIVATMPSLSFLVTGDYLLHLNAWTFGWPVSLLFIAVGILASPVLRKRMAFPLTLVASLLVAYFFCRFPNVHDVGPVYLFDALPFLAVATAIAIAGLGEALSRIPLNGTVYWAEIPICLSAALFILTWPVFQRTQAISLRALADNVQAPFELLEDARLHRALVFMGSRNAGRNVSWVYFPPLPKPDFSDDVLYVRDASSAAEDLDFARRFPDRTPYRMRRDPDGVWHLAAFGTRDAVDNPRWMRTPRVGDPSSMALTPQVD